MLQSGANVDTVLTKLLQFLYTASDWAGSLVVAGIHSILPSLSVPSSLASSIGLLAAISVLLGIAEVAKKVVWIVVIAGWVLVVVRIGLVIIQGGW